ncbi:MAG: hypothetical protein NBV61_03895 [Algoriphagus sp.]|nr:hypothetical protein [Algoriphagus sp.]
MAEKESSSKQWSDPKDFGLPFVEITPLTSTKAKAKAKEIQPVPVIPVDEPPKVAVAPKQEKKKETKQIRPMSPPQAPSAKKQVSKTWVWVVVFAFLGAISVIVWQLQFGSLLSSDLGDQSKKELAQKLPEEKKANVEVTPVPITDSLAKGDSLAAIGATTNLVTAANSGTTIASTNPVNLIAITSKGDKKRFFLVIASLPKETLIQDFASKMSTKPTAMYLITPYTDSPNYRLAIGKFDSWNAASEELAKVKSQYAADLWILNY